MQMKGGISGFNEAKKLLDQLPDKVSRRVAQAAVMAAGREVRKEVKKAYPPSADAHRSPASKKYGHGRDNIRVIKLRRVPKGTAAARVDTGNAFWLRFIEFGTRYIAANPIFSNAFNRAAPAGFDKMRDTLAKRLEKETEKLAQSVGATRGRK